jgi:transcription elongation GreA/GreB family factor
MSPVDKAQIFQAILEKIQLDRDSVRGAAAAAHDAATHDESRAEDHHDTRAIEASYLAGAASERAAELDRLVTYFRALGFSARDRAVEGALVTLSVDGAKRMVCWLASRGGGPHVQVGTQSVQWVTPQSPLGEALWGKVAGETFEVETQAHTREYEIEHVE